MADYDTKFEKNQRVGIFKKIQNLTKLWVTKLRVA